MTPAIAALNRRHIANLRAELKHARIQLRRARTSFDHWQAVGNRDLSVQTTRRMALATASVTRWADAVNRALTSLALMGVYDA
jgi:hypothetical protein